MDIDPLWITAGWLITTGSSFMAPATKSTVLPESQAMLLFLGLLLVVSLLARPIDPKKLTQSPTTELHPQQTKHIPPYASSSVAATISGSDSGQQFKAAAHEVPSGPNPESNK
ncbi:hypothetical protein P3X46_027405 [Hevea brasiliensis]|nr:CLAVATA3/ESR (CLE)-related protein TDIF [Hevea brasiliensis]XP_057993167.1 CLAVATA3/ESR (CLE)-related protein TDIF-like [Hevea brasiliensis]KAJ9129032.1 hypothetical protein P3X46_034206 [Hevea brasiliensis]KAJ9154026.1 hypothetical protein P3X46_027405 [Hevea brasiliensis]